MEAVPHLMRVLRVQVRQQSSPDLTMPQFRTLAFLGRNEDAMLSDVATFLGLTPPAASKLVDGLVEARLISRTPGTEDRRRVVLTLTPTGHRQYDRMVAGAEDFLAKRIEQLGAETRGELVRGLHALHTIFEDPPEVRRTTPRKNAKLK
jgi:DNA-binding MarR family transcriptional regulator